MTEEITRLFALAREELTAPPATRGERRLTDQEITLLEKACCSSSDWASVLVTERTDLHRIRSTRFEGMISIDLAPDDFNTPFGRRESGLSGVLLRDVSVSGSVCLTGTALVEGFTIHDRVSIEDSGSIRFTPGTAFGSGIRLDPGLETGERSVRSFPCLTVELARDLSDGIQRDRLLTPYTENLDSLVSFLTLRERGDICSGTSIRAVPVIEDSWIGESAVLDNCLSLRNTTVLGGEGCGVRICDGALVRNSILQWGSIVDSMAVVEDSVVCEAASVERQAGLRVSVLGPDSILSDGEMTACLAGPFTSMHHRSLLIATRWPGGRGNVGYGANIGSNHTSRAPDQEMICGEGMFFGLDCAVKFPSDFSRAAYTILATGVTTLPQRFVFPFSLICTPKSLPDGVPSGWNQTIPGWVLSDNLYAIKRNEGKYVSRRRASRNDMDSRIIRADTVMLMLEAITLLQGAPDTPVHTDSEVDGLGRNFMLEEHRLRAIDTYSGFVRFWALSLLLEAVEGEGSALPLDGIPDSGPGDWSLAREILQSEFEDVSLPELLGMLPYLAEEQLESVRESRMKDGCRGARIIPDYDHIHLPVEEDPVILDTASEFESLISRIHSVMERYRHS